MLVRKDHKWAVSVKLCKGLLTALFLDVWSWPRWPQLARRRARRMTEDRWDTAEAEEEDVKAERHSKSEATAEHRDGS